MRGTWERTVGLRVLIPPLTSLSVKDLAAVGIWDMCVSAPPPMLVALAPRPHFAFTQETGSLHTLGPLVALSPVTVTAH